MTQPSPPASFRPAQPHDQDEVSVLWLRLLEEQAEVEDSFAPSEDALARWRNDYREWLRDDSVFIHLAEMDDEPVGFVSAHLWTPPPIYRSVRGAYIDELFVLASRRGQGIGSALVDAVRDWAQEAGAEEIRLGVLAANERGQAFWQKQQARPLSVTYTMPLASPDHGDEFPKKDSQIGF